MNIVNGQRTTEESIKQMLNREYGFYFKKNHILDIYSEDKPFIKLPFTNEAQR